MATAPTPISAGPALPNSSDPDTTFDPMFEAFFAWEKNVLQPGANAIAANVYANAQIAEDKAIEAIASALAASDSEDAAAASALAASNSEDAAATLVGNYLAGPYSTDPATKPGGAALVDGNWYINTVTGFIRAYTVAGGWVTGIGAVAGVSSLNGLTGNVVAPTQLEAETGTENTKPMTALRTAQAIAALAAPSVVTSVRGSNAALTVSDKAKWINITSGTFTQTFEAAATLGNGWWCYLSNTGTGDITLDPNGAETVDSLTSYVMYPGEARLIQCDGSAFTSIVLTPFFKVFEASGNFIKPPGYSAFESLIWGAGNSGAADEGGSNVPGGGGGGCGRFSIPAAALAASTVVTVGAGGLSVTSTGALVPGNVGGGSSIGTVAVVAPATLYNRGGAVADPSGSPITTADPLNGIGASTSDTSDTSDTYWGGGASNSGSANSIARSSIYGGGAGAKYYSGAGTAGTSKFGGNGGVVNTNPTSVNSASNGSIPGGGGGAGRNNTFNIARSGAGARGEVRIWGIA